MAGVRFAAHMKKILLALTFIMLIMPFARADEYYYDLNDKKFTYEQLISNPKTILFVWATWCPTCCEKVKEFAAEKKMRSDVKIVFLEVGDGRSEVLNTLKHLGVPAATQALFYRDPFQAIAGRFFFNVVPTVMFLQDGKVTKTAHSLTSSLVDQVYPPEKTKTGNAHVI